MDMNAYLMLGRDKRPPVSNSSLMSAVLSPPTKIRVSVHVGGLWPETVQMQPLAQVESWINEHAAVSLS